MRLNDFAAALPVPALLAALLAAPTGATAQEITVPEFDVPAYCEQIAARTGGGYSMQEYCLNSERDAEASVRRDAAAGRVDDELLDMCSRLARVSPSYEMLAYCLDSERAARAELARLQEAANAAGDADFAAIRSRCARTAGFAGGSFEMIVYCVEEELAARARLQAQ